MKLKAIIQSLDSKKGYIVTTNDGREFIVRNIDEAIKEIKWNTWAVKIE